MPPVNLATYELMEEKKIELKGEPDTAYFEKALSQLKETEETIENILRYRRVSSRLSTNALPSIGSISPHEIEKTKAISLPNDI